MTSDGSVVGGRGVPADRLPVGAPASAGAGSGMDFAANVDGRWAPSWSAFEIELRRLTALMGRVEAAGANRAPEELTDLEQFVQGVKMAAAWTLGTSSVPPLSGNVPAPVSNAAIARVVANAERVMVRQPVIRRYAEGVGAWLLWITGQAPEIAYPAS
jgi:hypothetical protein